MALSAALRSATAIPPLAARSPYLQLGRPSPIPALPRRPLSPERQPPRRSRLRRVRHYRRALAAAPPLAARDRPAAMGAGVFPAAPAAALKPGAARAIPTLGAEIP